MFLGIEIGGSKLQFGVGTGHGPPLVALERVAVDPRRGGGGIRREIQRLLGTLLQEHDIKAIGIGFGGPVDAAAGRTIVSHQVEGWKDFPLVEWCRKEFGLSVALGNDSDLAGLGEARFGAGRGERVVFYTNVGSGIGGALVIDGQLYHGSGKAACELGHLRPGLQSQRPDQTLESIASGWAIAAAAQARLGEPVSHPLEPWIDGVPRHQPEAVRQRLIELEEADEESAADLLERCQGQADRLSAAIVAQAAADGNRLAREVLEHACQAYGWAIAQAITLISPNVVVIGGGVALAGEQLVLTPVRKYVEQYVFPPLLGSYRIVAAELGEETVVHGALALAAMV